jgi:hypothetical protein
MHAQKCERDVIECGEQKAIELQIGFGGAARGWPPTAVLETAYASFCQTHIGISAMEPEEMSAEATTTVQQISGVAEFFAALLVIVL